MDKETTMLQMTKRIALAATVAAALAVPSGADARINMEPNAQTASIAEVGATGSQSGGIQAPANGFDWGDAGIGAAATALLIGAGGILVGRRRSARRVVAG
jgi:hypothetical protein